MTFTARVQGALCYNRNMQNSELSPWLLPTLLTLFMWGLWGFFPKLTTQYIDPKSALIFEVIGAALIGGIVWALMGTRQVQVHPLGALYGILTGVVSTLGTLFFLYAVTRGKTSLIVTATSLYPLITIGLVHFILKEPVTPRQLLGIAFALIAILLLATK